MHPGPWPLNKTTGLKRKSSHFVQDTWNMRYMPQRRMNGNLGNKSDDVVDWVSTTPPSGPPPPEAAPIL